MTTADKDFNLHGIYRDILYDQNGRVKYDSGWKSNLIVDQARILLATFLKDDPANGISCLKVGKGDASWDDEPPTPQTDSRKLVDDDPLVLERPRLVMEYLEEDNTTSPTPTNRIQIRATLGANEPPVEAGVTVCPLREFGLFGLLNEIAYMIDYVIHPVINKATTDTLIRTIRLNF